MLGFRLRFHGFVTVFFLLNWACTVFAAADPGYHKLERRIPGEHVILADCRDNNAVVSSQMAYYNSTPGPRPNDVSIVHTNPGEAALWINRVTEGLFTDTGVTFVATLGPKVADGQFAGTGQNGYANFTCWQRYFKELYKYDGTTCSQVYDCNHDDPPGQFAPLFLQSHPQMLHATNSLLIAVLPTPIDGGDSSPAPSSSQSQGGVSQGAVVGIVVGVVGAVLLAASIGLFYWYWKRTHNSKQESPAYSKRGGFCCGLFGAKEVTEQPPGSPIQSVKEYPADDPNKVFTPMAYELDGHWNRAELETGHGRVEIDTEHKAEIDSTPAEPFKTHQHISEGIDSPSLGYLPSPLTAGPEKPPFHQNADFIEPANDYPKK